MVRRSSTINFERIAHIQDKLTLHQADLLDQLSIINLIQETRPQEVYNFAAQSFVPTSFQQPILTGEFTALGVARMLEAIRLVDPTIRFYQASSSEMFGKVREEPQNEHTPFWPRSPYGVAKAYGHWITVNYRESYNIYRLLRHTVQSRIALARQGVCYPQNQLRRGADQTRPAEGIVDGQSRRYARLGLCRRLRPGMLADASTGQTRRLCDRHRDKTLGARFPGIGLFTCGPQLAAITYASIQSISGRPM